MNGTAAPAEALVAPPADPPIRFDLRAPVPDLALFPRTSWVRAARAAMATLPDDDLGYGDPRGLLRLREALADYLGRVRGVATTPDRVMVTNGFLHGCGLILECLRDDGASVVAIEDPGYEDSRAVARRLGLRVRDVPVDWEGLDVEAIRSSGAPVVTATPAHQSPTGAVLSAERRTSLVAWARGTGGYVIEDDYDPELRYDRQPIGALQGLAPDRTIYVGTLSKSLAPGVRMGWIVLPAELVDPVVALRSLVDGATSAIDQATFAEVLERGDHDRHLRRVRRVYRRRRDALVVALREALPDAAPGEVAPGLHVPLDLPAHVDEAKVVAEASRLGVRVGDMDWFRSRPMPEQPGLVVGFGWLRTEDAPEAAALLAQAVERAHR